MTRREGRSATGPSATGPSTEARVASLARRYRRALSRRAEWESHWRECYDYALPQRGGGFAGAAPGGRRGGRVFDGTAPDAVDQLAAALLAQLTPPWSAWFGFAPGSEVDAAAGAVLAAELEQAAAVVQAHFDRSNFAVEVHQCYLDLVTGGTACLQFEEAGAGSHSAFRFAAVPLAEAVLEEGPDGLLDVTFRRRAMTLAAIRRRFPDAVLPLDVERRGGDDPDSRFPVIEAVLPEAAGYGYAAFLDGATTVPPLAEGRFATPPFINFRWLKAPGEAYGRSPVMKALPDIRTANKVVELVLKNASIAVTGIWQADDDGVLNIANIRLEPGTVIPKAVGSGGLTPLQAPGRFDVSQLVLDDLRGRIRRALLADGLGPVPGPRMTATEVLERAAETSRILGATFGRLQSELLTPLIRRAVAILARRGEIPDLVLDGRLVALKYKSPLARIQAQADAAATGSWLQTAAALGPEAMAAVDVAAAVRWMASALGVPGTLVRPSAPDPLGSLGPLDLLAGEGGDA